MPEARLRAAVTATAVTLAIGALWWLPQRPAPRPPLPVDTGAPAPPVVRADTIRRGEGMVGALTRLGLAPDDARAVARAAGLRGTARRDVPVALRSDSAGVPPADLDFTVADDKTIRVRRTGDGWEASQRRHTWIVDTVVVRGTFDRTLVRTVRDADAPVAIPPHVRTEIAYAISEAFLYRLDVSRDLDPGDSVVAVVERRRTALGTVRLGALLGAAIHAGDRWLDATRHERPDGGADWFDAAGKPLRTSFLDAPLDVVRISSRFGRRFHPVLGIWHQHAGTDYAAPTGTPVHTVGDGVVTVAGRKGAYGNLLEIRHPNGVVTRYGHLSRFARGIRPGSRVARGGVVAYVGSTGRSTAPHLHFEVMVGGAQREPARALRAAAGIPLRGDELAAFLGDRTAILGRLGIPALLPRPTLATAPTPAAQPPATGAQPPAPPARRPAAGTTGDVR